MRSIVTGCLSLLSGFGLLATSASTGSAGNPICKPCSSAVVVTPALVPVLRVETPVMVDGLIVAPIPTGHALLVLTCPAEARVTIDGRLTHSSGATRQYHLSFDGDVHICHVEIRLRDNDEEATFHFGTHLECFDHQRAVLSVSRHQMEKTRDPKTIDELSTLLSPGATLTVTDDHKLVPFTAPESTVSSRTRRRESRQLAAPNGVHPRGKATKSKQPSLQDLAIDHQTKILGQQQAEANRLTSIVRAKATRLDAAARVRKLAEDALQVKNAEVTAALNDAATYLAAGNTAKNVDLKGIASAKQVEAKKLELEITRAREIEQGATNELSAAQNQSNKADEKLRDAQEALKRIKGGSIQIELP